MDPAAAGPAAVVVWFVVYAGYVLLAGTGTFWALVWPDGHAVRRLRAVAVAGLALLGLGTLVEAGSTLLLAPDPTGATVTAGSATWLLVRLALCAAAGFFGAEVLRRPVRGARRVVVLVLVAALTTTLVASSTAAGVSRAAAVAVATGAYLVALAAWLGSLVAVAVLLGRREPPPGLTLETVWTRFSRLAGVAVVALVAAGTAQHLALGGALTARSGMLLAIEAGALALTLLLSRLAVAHGRRLAFRERYLRGLPVVPGGRASRLRPALGLQLVVCVALVGLAVAQLAVLPVPGRPVPPPLGEVVAAETVPSAREGRRADGEVPRFVPGRIVLPGEESAAVDPVATVGRELVVPEDPGRVGWWDGSSQVGDPYGSVVLAGHVDTIDRGLGFFFRLWNIEVGERVVLSAHGGDRRQAYRITARRQLPRTDLVDDEEVFAVDGPPRLVLITCAGEFRADRGGYRDNLVVVAEPVS